MYMMRMNQTVVDDLTVNMVDVGEETGELDTMLYKVADTYDEEVEVLTETLMSLMEPLADHFPRRSGRLYRHRPVPAVGQTDHVTERLRQELPRRRLAPMREPAWKQKEWFHDPRENRHVRRPTRYRCWHAASRWSKCWS